MEATPEASSSTATPTTTETQPIADATNESEDIDANAGAASCETNDKRPEDRTGQPTTTTATVESNEGQFSEQQNIDEECERLLRNAKKQVKQMMEEAVTKKFIHEESSSIIALCVAIDNCLSHGLKRRALGLFKSNSSTALIQKVAKSCPSAREILSLVDDEEKRQLEEQQQQQQHQQQQQQQQQQRRQQIQDHDGSNRRLVSNRSPIGQQAAAVAVVASNLSVHKRNRWIKCALIERKLVPIVEYLSENASKYYEPEALMSNYLSAQILCSLLVGPCALEFSRSKTNDYYQFEEPSADELLKRHKLSNPIACIHHHHHHHGGLYNHPAAYSQHGRHQGPLGAASSHAQLSRSATDHQCCHRNCHNSHHQKQQHHHHHQPPHQASPSKQSAHRSRRATTSQASVGTISAAASAAAAAAASASASAGAPQPQSHHDRLAETKRSTSDSVAQTMAAAAAAAASTAGSTSSPVGGGLARAGSGRRRPLALKTNMKIGALVTDCHHYSCQDISEHQQTRGYSFKCDGLNGLACTSAPQPLPLTTTLNSNSSNNNNNNSIKSFNQTGATSTAANSNFQQDPAGGGGGGGPVSQGAMGSPGPSQQESWTSWSPRMLHETLHQNSKSTLLYAKNNVLLETQPNQTMAGYLSLHQTSSDLILKWIPNQMINGCSSLPLACETSEVHHSNNGSCCPCCCTNSADETAGTDLQSKNQEAATTTLSNSSSSNNNNSNKIRSKSEDITLTNGSNNNNNSATTRPRHNQSCCCCSCNEDKSRYLRSQPVGSSYLDLIVSLSVSRIAMLHCHFDGHVTTTTSKSAIVLQAGETTNGADPVSPPDSADTPTNNNKSTSSSSSLPTYSSDKAIERAQQVPNQVTTETTKADLDHENNLSSASDTTTAATTTTTTTTTTFFYSTNEETLILVETDGVQRAPFKFPKGGLKWFLSCLENGLRPHKYLDPSVKPDKPIEMLPDPVNSLESIPNSTTSEDHQLTPNNSASTSSEQQFATSRLDMFLKRLPSLKRRAESPKCDPLRAESVASTTSQPDSRTTSPTPTTSGEHQSMIIKQMTSSQRVPIHYVYRIVSVQQQQQQQSTDWAQQQQQQQTPPHSATFSIGSSSSGSFGLALAAASLIKTNSNSHSRQATPVCDQGQQRFRWSLSRLARFSSNRNNSNSAGSTSTSSSLCYNSNTSYDTTPSTTTTTSTATGFSALNGRCGLNREDRVRGGTQVDEEASGLSSREFARIEAKLEDLKKSSSDELMALRTQSIQTLCESMRKQILARAFYGWLAYCRRAKIIRTHLTKLINAELYLIRDEDADDAGDSVDGNFDFELYEESKRGLTRERWLDIMRRGREEKMDEPELRRRINQLVYYGGIESNELRVEVWPYLLEHYKLDDDDETRRKKDLAITEAYRSCNQEWVKIERVVKQRDNEILAANMAKVARRNKQTSEASNNNNDNDNNISKGRDQNMPTLASGDAPTTGAKSGESDAPIISNNNGQPKVEQKARTISDTTRTSCCDDDDDDGGGGDDDKIQQDDKFEDHDDGPNKSEEDIVEVEENSEERSLNDHEAIGPDRIGNSITKDEPRGKPANGGGGPNNDKDNNTDRNHDNREASNCSNSSGSGRTIRDQQATRRRSRPSRRVRLESTGSVGSDASITDQFGNNVHRIDKDVQRCDRNFWYFKDTDNLDKLRNIMCNYVWQHLDIGYVQGMCDLAAPFLVIFNDEIKAYTCFNQLMKRMVANFPHGCAMDQHFESLKYLIQVLDPKLFEIFQRNGDYTHFYFCYRWLLLDFKRELAYDDVYRVWETIWSARYIATEHFVVFMALAMVRYYRDIIIENNMDFTDTIKFFNEMAERHDARSIIALARDCVVELEALVKSHGNTDLLM